MARAEPTVSWVTASFSVRALEARAALTIAPISAASDSIGTPSSPTKESIAMEDGRQLPLVKVETTSESHPFYTGTQKSVDSLGGRVEKFRNKFARVGIKK